MSLDFPFKSGEFRTVMQLLAALQQTLDIHQALRAAYPLLCQLVPADHGSMCISRNDNLNLYDWSVAEFPESFFRTYHEIAEHDFVRNAVANNPNLVLCDDIMLPRTERVDLERHPLVQHSRDNGVRIEQIMAVKIATQPMWNGGLTLYRDRPSAFSRRERTMLQELLPFFETTMANCKRFEKISNWSQLMEDAFAMYGTSILLFSPSLEWINATPGIERVLARCSDKKHGGVDGFLAKITTRLKEVASNGKLATPSPTWTPLHSGAGVSVRFQPLVKDAGMYWMVLLEEVPEHWRERLSKTEIDIAFYAAQGWDNDDIHKAFNIKKTTVKGHLTNVYNKLGLDGRSMLIAQFRSRR